MYNHITLCMEFAIKQCEFVLKQTMSNLTKIYYNGKFTQSFQQTTIVFN